MKIYYLSSFIFCITTLINGASSEKSNHKRIRRIASKLNSGQLRSDTFCSAQKYSEIRTCVAKEYASQFHHLPVYLVPYSESAYAPAVEHFLNNKFKKALSCLLSLKNNSCKPTSTVLDRFIDTPAIDTMIGYCFEKLGRPKEAMDYYHSAAKQGNTNAMQNLASVILKTKGSYEDAVFWLETAINTATEQGTPVKGEWINLGNAYKRLGLYTKAIKAFHHAESAGESLAIYNLGLAYKAAGNKLQALIYLQKAAEQGDPSAMNSLGLIALEEKRYKDALIHFSSVEQHPNSDIRLKAMALINTALAKFYTGKPDEAKSLLQEAITIGHAYTDILTNAQNNLAIVSAIPSDQAETIPYETALSDKIG